MYHFKTALLRFLGCGFLVLCKFFYLQPRSTVCITTLIFSFTLVITCRLDFQVVLYHEHGIAQPSLVAFYNSEFLLHWHGNKLPGFKSGCLALKGHGRLRQSWDVWARVLEDNWASQPQVNNERPSFVFLLPAISAIQWGQGFFILISFQMIQLQCVKLCLRHK